MFYTIFISIIGIYIGQEFNLPSVGTAVVTVWTFFKQNNQEQQEQVVGWFNEGFLRDYFTSLTNFIWKSATKQN